MSLSAGDVIDGKYRIIRLLGEGGMGAVYEGENARIQRKVAIKVLHAGVAENQDAVQRFEREAQAAGRIGSDHIVGVLDLGDLPSGDRYMVMEYLEGDSLSDRIRKRGKMTPTEIGPLVLQLLEGLAAAHGAGIIHRDLKPDNVFLIAGRKGQPDFVKILDFGISKFNALSGDSFSMTRTGAVMGTPYYMSPEQAKGSKTMDQRGDIYAVGVILYEAVTGQVPFNADTFNELLFKIVLETPPPVEQLAPDIDPGFAKIIGTAMARDPALRYQTCGDFLNAVAQWHSGAPAVSAASPLGMTAPGFNVSPIPTRIETSAPGVGQESRLGTGTPGTWANTPTPQAEPAVAAPAAKRMGPLIGAAIGAVVLIGGFVVSRMRAEPPTDDATQAATAPATTEKPPEERALKAAIPKENPAAPVAPAAASPAPSSASPVAAPSTSQAPVAVLPTPGIHRPTSGGAKPPEPSNAAPKPPAPPSTGGKSGGRRIRTEL